MFPTIRGAVGKVNGVANSFLWGVWVSIGDYSRMGFVDSSNRRMVESSNREDSQGKKCYPVFIKTG